MLNHLYMYLLVDRLYTIYYILYITFFILWVDQLSDIIFSILIVGMNKIWSE